MDSHELAIARFLLFSCIFILFHQGRNPAGQVGLFPQSYTSPTPPSSSTITFPDNSTRESSASNAPPSAVALQSLPEEAEVATNGSKATNGESKHERKISEGDVMMRATMTDVQRAIEQLGRNDRDGARSFSFASSHGDYSERSETETEDDREGEGDDELGWHKDARKKLAQRAQRENEQRQAREAEEQERVMIPPIDVEVSDESDADDEDSPASPRRHPAYPKITEEDEEEAEESLRKPSPTPSAHNGQDSGESIIPSARYLIQDETDLPTATAATFPNRSPVASFVALPVSTVPPVEVTEPTLSEALTPTEPAPDSTPVPTPVVEATLLPPAAASIPLPSSPIALEAPVEHMPPVITPTPIIVKAGEQLPSATPSTPVSPTASSAGSYAISSGAGIQQTLTPATTIASLSTPHQSGTTTPDQSKKTNSHPSEWSVDEVVDWLKSKAFDQGVCDKFIGMCRVRIYRFFTKIRYRARDHR